MRAAGHKLDGDHHSPLGVVLRLLSFQAYIETNCGRSLEDLVSMYPLSRPVEGADSLYSSARYALKECNREGRQPVYLVRGESGRIDFFDAVQDAVAYLDHLLGLAAVRSLNTHMLVHAGAVAWEGGGILIPGASGAGKSTLVAGLAMSGFSYLSDELAVVETWSGRLLPFLKPICLKRGGWRALINEVGVPPTAVVTARRIDGEAVDYFAAPEMGVPEEHTPVRYVLLPDRSTGSRPKLSECSRSRALVELARNSLNLPSHGAPGIETLAKLVEGAECYVLSYCDLSAAMEMVIGLVRRAGQAHRGRAAAVPKSEGSSAA